MFFKWRMLRVARIANRQLADILDDYIASEEDYIINGGQDV